MCKKMKPKMGGYMLLAGMLASILSILLAGAYFTTLGGAFGLIKNSQTALHAQQYAEIDANSLRLMPYDEVTAQSRQAIDDIIDATGWQDEIILGPEKTIGSGDAKQRIATVKIYKNGDALPRYSLSIPLSSPGSSGGVPIGAVIAWPLATDPDGADKNKWLECNGQVINSAKYPKLAAKMNYTPNYSGVFLRGLGNQQSSHYGSVLHQSAALGELQGDSIRDLYGTFGAVTWFLDSSATGAFYYSDKAWGYDIDEDFGTEWNDIGIATFSAARIVPTANENRPINRAVRYLIRAA